MGSMVSIIAAGVADALSQGIPTVLGSSSDQVGSEVDASGALSKSSLASSATSPELRRQPSAAQRALSGIAAALGGGGGNSPTHAGLPSK